MGEGVKRAVLFLIVSLLALVRASYGQVCVTVIDDGFSFSPDPVCIVTGECVYWIDDGSGPYTIYSDTAAWTPFDTPGGILFTQAGSYGYSDDFLHSGTVNVSVNVPPSVTITNPANNAVFTPPASFTFAANASDTDCDGLSDVAFYVGTTLVADVFSSPYSTVVTNLAAGNYTLKVIAYDNGGGSATNSITIHVQIILSGVKVTAGQFLFTATGLTVGKTNIVEVSTNLVPSANWSGIGTNLATSTSASFTNAVSGKSRFFRLHQLP